MYQSGKILAIAALFLTSSCKKDITDPLKGNDEAAAASISDSSTVADNAFNDVLVNAFYGTSDKMAAGGSNALGQGGTTVNATEVMNYIYLSCATYTLTTTSGGYPMTLTLDFGTDGCSGSIDSVKRQGKIIYVFSGSLLTPGSEVSASFDHYFVNGYGLQGSVTITNTSNQDGFGYNLQISNGIFTFPDQTNFHYSANKTVQMSAGSATPFNILDDVYAITGNSNFSASDGTSLVSTVTTPLSKTFICPFINAGVISFVYNQGLTGTIDFGNGDCDNKATLNVGSISREITLR
jgi:hypothetical protein